MVEKVLAPLWKDRKAVRPRAGDRLEQFYNRLLPYYGMGSFMVGQIIADTKFTVPLNNAEDWWTWATVGPGSARGLNAVLGRDFNTSWCGEEWYSQLQLLQTKIDPLVRTAKMPRISAQDLQNCLCEYSGYFKVRHLGMRKKQLYPGLP